MTKRALPVIIVACLYVVIGVGGFAQHFSELRAQPWQSDAIWPEAVSLIAIVAGVYLLRGKNWARWLALGWIGFHVVLSFFHTRMELAIHCLVFLILVVLLFGPPAARYFRGADDQAAGAR